MSGRPLLEHVFQWDVLKANKNQFEYVSRQLAATVEEIATPISRNQEISKYTRTRVYKDPRSKIKIEKILGEGSYGIAFAAIYPEESNTNIVIKSLQNNKEIQLEYFVGAYGINLLCDIVPNLMYTYGYVECDNLKNRPELEEKTSPPLAPNEELPYEEVMAMVEKQANRIPEMCDDPDTTQAYLVLEKIEGQLLEKLLSQITQTELCQILLQIYLTLQIGQDHPLGWQHWDLRASNVMIKRYNHDVIIPYMYKGTIYEVTTRVVPVIIDYGFSCITHLTNQNGHINRFIGQVSFPKLYILPGVVPGEDCFTLIFTIGNVSMNIRVAPDVKKLISYLLEFIGLNSPSKFNVVTENYGYIPNSVDVIRMVPPIGFAKYLLKYMKKHNLEKDIIRVYPYTVPICKISTRDYPYINISPSISQELCKATTIKSEVVCLYRKSIGEAYGVSENRTIAKDLQVFMKYETLPLPRSSVPDLSNNPSLEDLITFSQLYMFVMYMKEFMSFSYYVRQLGLQEMFKLDEFLSSRHVESYNALYDSVYTYYFQIKQEFILKFLEKGVPEKLVWFFKYVNKPPSIFDL